MLSNTRQNFHHSKLPKPGAIVTVNMGPFVRINTKRKWIVESFPLCNNALPYSFGIHTVNLRALDNGKRATISGFYCEEID